MFGVMPVLEAAKSRTYERAVRGMTGRSPQRGVAERSGPTGMFSRRLSSGKLAIRFSSQRPCSQVREESSSRFPAVPGEFPDAGGE
jgi:hypothetical protein